MWGYFIGSILTLFSAISFQLFGICILKNQKSYSFSFIIGYIFYSFLVAIGGIPIQILNLPWMTFYWYMIIILIGIVIFICFNFYTRKVILKKEEIVNYIKENWFLYIGAILLLGFALTHISIIWLNNMSDDAYYLTKMATLPYLENPFRTDYTTGFIDLNLSTYLLNTFELEASFYIFVTGMDPSLYARVFLALLNYFILLNAIKAFIEILIRKMGVNTKQNAIQYCIVTIFFAFIFSATFFFSTDAQWTILSAAYYGSSLSRIGCIFIALTPLLDFSGLNKEKVIITIMSCVVMISKSTVSIPLIFMLGIGYILVDFLIIQKKLHFFLIPVTLFVCGFLLSNNDIVEEVVVSNLLENFMKPLIIISIILLVLGSIKFSIIRNISLILLICFLLMVLPELNNLTEKIMQYDFVATRTIYSLFVFILILSYGLAFTIICSALSKQYLCSFINVLTIILVVLSSVITTFEWTYPIKALNTYSKNINLLPDSTILLGEKLEQFYQETGVELNMVMTPGVYVNGLGHFSSQIVRAYAPHAISVTAGLRVAEVIENSNTSFDGFSVKDVECFNELFVNPTEKKLDSVRKICNKYPINCIVANDMNGTNPKLLQLMQSIGFKKYDAVTDPQAEPALTYTIYIKDSLLQE